MKTDKQQTPTLILALWLCARMKGGGAWLLKDSGSFSSWRWDFRARFTATLLENQACFTQTKGRERAQASVASSCSALLSSRAGYTERDWSVTKKQCARSRFVSLPRRISIVNPRNGFSEEKELTHTLNFILDHCVQTKAFGLSVTIVTKSYFTFFKSGLIEDIVSLGYITNQELYILFLTTKLCLQQVRIDDISLTKINQRRLRQGTKSSQGVWQINIWSPYRVGFLTGKRHCILLP